MAEDFSKTVRIDLMPDVEGEALAGGDKPRGDHLAKANWSTRKRQTAAAAAATRSRYEDLLQSVYDAAVITSISGRILEVNGRAVEFLRHERAALCTMSFTDLLDGADESLMKSIADTLEQERFALLQAYCRRRDGTSFPAEIAVSRLSADKVRLCFFIRDITVRRQTEEMLRTEHTAVQTCGSGIAIADVDGLLGYVNPAFTRLLATDGESLLHEDIREVLGAPEAIGELIESSLNDDQTWMSEIAFTNGDGDPLYVQVSATCSRGTDGEPRGIVFSFADITLHKQAEDAAEAAQAELEARVEARTMDLINRNARLEEELEGVKQKLEKQKAETGSGERESLQ
jgi:PAS domain S-box-containing protein